MNDDNKVLELENRNKFGAALACIRTVRPSALRKQLDHRDDTVISTSATVRDGLPINQNCERDWCHLQNDSHFGPRLRDSCSQTLLQPHDLCMEAKTPSKSNLCAKAMCASTSHGTQCAQSSDLRGMGQGTHLDEKSRRSKTSSKISIVNDPPEAKAPRQPVRRSQNWS